MDSPPGVGWQWWMAPTRAIGRLRPTLLAAAAADAVVLRRLPNALVAVGLPLLVVVLAGAVSTLHATTSVQHVSPHIDWLRLQMDDVFTEAPLFILIAIGIGVFSPPLAVLLVAVFGIFDIAAAALQVDELRPLPGALAGRLVGIWLLWLLVVEIPALGRVLALSVRRLARSRVAVAALNGLVTSGLTLLWTQAAAVLIRPAILWSSIPTGARVEHIQPIQVGGIIFAIVAGAIAAAVAFARGPSLLLSPVAPRSPSQPGPWSIPVTVGRRLLVAGLLTVGLGGLMTTPLDAAVLFVALAGARPLGSFIARNTAVGVLLARLTPIVRIGLAIGLVFVVASLTVGAGGLKGVSEFFSVIAAVAVGLFVIELVTAPGVPGAQLRSSLARGAGMGGAVALALVAVSVAAPVAALADNCANFTDCWSTVALGILAAVAIPTLFALGASEKFLGWYGNQLFGPRPPAPPTPKEKPPLTWDSHTPRERARHKERDEEEF